MFHGTLPAFAVYKSKLVTQRILSLKKFRTTQDKNKKKEKVADREKRSTEISSVAVARQATVKGTNRRPRPNIRPDKRPYQNTFPTVLFWLLSNTLQIQRAKNMFLTVSPFFLFFLASCQSLTHLSKFKEFVKF